MKLKTVADLKRTIKPGMKLIHTARQERVADYDGNTTLTDVAIPPKLTGKRTVTKVDTTGFYMSKTPEDGKHGSFLGFPKAKDFSVQDESTFTITDHDKDGKLWLSMTYQIIT